MTTPQMDLGKDCHTNVCRKKKKKSMYSTHKQNTITIWFTCRLILVQSMYRCPYNLPVGTLPTGETETRHIRNSTFSKPSSIYTSYDIGHSSPIALPRYRYATEGPYLYRVLYHRTTSSVLSSWLSVSTQQEEQDVFLTDSLSVCVYCMYLYICVDILSKI